MNPIRRWLVSFWLALLLASSACQEGLPSAVSTITARIPTPTPSLTSSIPNIMCTPPLCWDGEGYFCPAQCPGGCGTTCATTTPDPQSSPTPTFPPLVDFCKLPTPGPDTAAPVVAACTSSAQLRVGETLYLSARTPMSSNYASFQVTFADREPQNSTSVRIRSDGRTLGAAFLDANLALVSARVDDPVLYIVLVAHRTGSTQIKVWAEGGIWSEPLEVVVVP